MKQYRILMAITLFATQYTLYPMLAHTSKMQRATTQLIQQRARFATETCWQNEHGYGIIGYHNKKIPTHVALKDSQGRMHFEIIQKYPHATCFTSELMNQLDKKISRDTSNKLISYMHTKSCDLEHFISNKKFNEVEQTLSIFFHHQDLDQDVAKKLSNIEDVVHAVMQKKFGITYKDAVFTDHKLREYEEKLAESTTYHNACTTLLENYRKFYKK